jgi:PAS domain S-box-containing protein
MYRILYVDDEPGLLEIGKLFLERSGQFIVDTTTSAPAALTLMDKKNFDAIISDYQMPEMDGIEFLKTIRSSGNKIPFILFTGKGREEVVIQALNAGADFYLQKGGEAESQFAELSNKIHYAVMKRSLDESLRESQRMLAEAMALANLVNWECDLSTGILTFDERFSTLYGTTPDHHGINHMTAEAYIQELVHPEDLQILAEEDEKTRTTTDPNYVSKREYRIIRRDGKIRYIEMCVGITKDAQGRTIKTHGVNQDITERKKSETELRAAYEQIAAQEEELRGQYNSMVTLQHQTVESQQMLTDVLNTVPVRVFWKDRDLRFMGCNEAFVRDTGLSDPTALIGKTDFDMTWRDEAELYRVDDRKVIDTGIPKIGYEEPQTSADGKRIWLRTSKVPLRNPDGTIIGILGTCEDITENKRADAALRESEQRYRNVVEDQTELISRFLPNGTHVFVNDTYCRYFGLNREDIIRHRFRPKIPVEDQARVKRFFGSLTPDHPVESIEHRIIMPDGTLRWQQWSDRAIFDDSGTVTEYQSVGRDITKEMATRTALAKSEIRFREQYQSNPLAIFTWQDRDGDFVLVDCNKAAETLSGGRAHGFLGKTASTLYATRPEIISGIRRCFSDRTVISTEITSEHFLPGKLIHATAAFVPPDLIIVHMEDITEQKEAEKALRESEEKFRSFVENADDIIYSITPEGIFTYVSPQCTEILGYETNEWIGKSAATLIHPDDFPRNREFFRQTFLTGKKTSGLEYRIRHKNGTWQWHSQNGSLMRDAGGNIIAYLGIGRDITKQKKTEEALYRANRQLSLLSGVTRHDILNRISGILAYLELAGMNVSDPTLGMYLGKIESAVTEIQSEIEFTRVYQDLGTNEPQWIELDGVLPRSQVPATITLHADVQGVEVFADPMLEKIFFNLLDNSIRHGQRVSEIRVSSHKSGGDLVVVWEDNGVGVAADEKERIFERGFGKNTGLGMFLIREILSLTGITIRETGEPGKGVRFEMVVPKRQYRFVDQKQKKRSGD